MQSALARNCSWCDFEFFNRIRQKRSIKRGSHGREVQRDRLDLDAHDMRLLRFLGHRVERFTLGPVADLRVDSVCNGSPLRRFVLTCENRPRRLTGVDMTMDRMRFTNVSEMLWQDHDRWACQVDRRAGHGAILPRASSSARAATAEHA